jgi:pilus assembly protein CpaF
MKVASPAPGPAPDEVGRFKRLLLSDVDLQELSRLDVNRRREMLDRAVRELISREGVILKTRARNDLVRRVVDEALGLGILEPLLADDSISEIMINGYESIYVQRIGRPITAIPSGFTSEEQLRQVIDRIVSTVNRRVDESSPMVDARIPANPRMPRDARVNVILPPLALNGPTVSIRLFPRVFDLDELTRRQSIDPATADLLAVAVRARLNVVVSGGTASGKTTLLNVLSSFIPDHERIITVEDAAELTLAQEHVVRLETRPPNTEGRGQVVIRDLVRNALRMRPDRIIVGEVRAGEALDMLQAMQTGHEGSLVTIHANSPVDALARLETLASMSDIDLPFDAIHDQVNSAIDLIVQLERAADGTRRVHEVSFLRSQRKADYDLVPLVRFVAGRTGQGPFARQPLPPELVDRLAARGEAPPASWNLADPGRGGTR